MKKVKEILHKLNVIYNRRQKIKMSILAVLILFSSFLELVGISLIFPFIGIVISPEKITSGQKLSAIYKFFGMHSTTDFLIFLAVLLIVVYLAKNVYMLFVYYCQYRILYNAQKDISHQLMSFYLTQPYSYHLGVNSSVMIRIVTGDTGNCSTFVTNLTFLFTEFSVFLFVSILLFFINKIVTIVLVIMFVVIFLGIFKNLKAKLKKYSEINIKHQSGMIKWVQQAIGAIKDIKILQKEKFFVDNYYDSATKLVSAQRNFNILQQLPRLLIETIVVVSILAVIVILLVKGINSTTIVAQMAVFAMAAVRLMPSLNRMQIAVNTMMFLMPSVNAVYDDLKNTRGKDFREYDAGKTVDFKRDISINSISFKYPKTEKYIFKDVSFNIKNGTSVGFIGPTGAGKTTIVDVILGLLNPTDGTITVDGVDIHKNKKSWFANIGYVPQMIYLTNDTIRNNIIFYDEKNEDKEQLERVIEQAQLKEFIDELPKGLDTEVGERGMRLSGGQRQRIGIARALYNKPSLLVLDEATSALDNNTEKYVMEAIENLYGKITMLIIAHRLTTIEKCDVVYELKGGVLNKVEKLKK